VPALRQAARPRRRRPGHAPARALHHHRRRLRRTLRALLRQGGAAPVAVRRARRRQLDAQGFTESGYMKSVNVKVYGKFQFRASRSRPSRLHLPARPRLVPRAVRLHDAEREPRSPSSSRPPRGADVSASKPSGALRGGAQLSGEGKQEAFDEERSWRARRGRGAERPLHARGDRGRGRAERRVILKDPTLIRNHRRDPGGRRARRPTLEGRRLARRPPA